MNAVLVLVRDHFEMSRLVRGLDQPPERIVEAFAGVAEALSRAAAGVLAIGGGAFRRPSEGGAGRQASAPGKGAAPRLRRRP